MFGFLFLAIRLFENKANISGYPKNHYYKSKYFLIFKAKPSCKSLVDLFLLENNGFLWVLFGVYDVELFRVINW